MIKSTYDYFAENDDAYINSFTSCYNFVSCASGGLNRGFRRFLSQKSRVILLGHIEEGLEECKRDTHGIGYSGEYMVFPSMVPASPKAVAVITYKGKIVAIHRSDGISEYYTDDVTKKLFGYEKVYSIGLYFNDIISSLWLAIFPKGTTTPHGYRLDNPETRAKILDKEITIQTVILPIDKGDKERYELIQKMLAKQSLFIPHVGDGFIIPLLAQTVCTNPTQVTYPYVVYTSWSTKNTLFVSPTIFRSRVFGSGVGWTTKLFGTAEEMLPVMANCCNLFYVLCARKDSVVNSILKEIQRVIKEKKRFNGNEYLISSGIITPEIDRTLQDNGISLSNAIDIVGMFLEEYKKFVDDPKLFGYDESDYSPLMKKSTIAELLAVDIYDEKQKEDTPTLKKRKILLDRADAFFGAAMLLYFTALGSAQLPIASSGFLHHLYSSVGSKLSGNETEYEYHPIRIKHIKDHISCAIKSYGSLTYPEQEGVPLNGKELAEAFDYDKTTLITASNVPNILTLMLLKSAGVISG